MSNFPYNSQLEKDEHRKENNAKAVDLYGWNSDLLEWVRLSVDDNGVIGSSNPALDYNMCYVDEDAPLTYITSEKVNGAWLVTKFDETSGTVATYATIKNNPSVTTTADARTNRATLTYQLPNQAF